MSYKSKYLKIRWFKRDGYIEGDKFKDLRKMTCLILLNKKYFDSNFSHLGSVKDHDNTIASSCSNFNLTFVAGVSTKIHACLGLFNLKIRLIQRSVNPEIIVLSFSGHAWYLCILTKVLFPTSKLIFRSHNAELPHRLDYSHCETRSLRKKKFWRRRAFFGLLSDWVSGTVCDVIFGISRYDNYHYWNKIIRKSEKIIYFPYCNRSNDFDKNVIVKKNLRQKNISSAPEIGHWSKKSTIGQKIVAASIGSSNPGPITHDQELQFYKFANELNKETSEKFVLAQTNPQFPKKTPSNVIKIEKNEFEDFSKNINICLVLGKWGRGTKTKIVDCVLEGTPVICHQAIFNRLDVEFRIGVLPWSEKEGNPTELMEQAIKLLKSRKPTKLKQSLIARCEMSFQLALRK